MAQWLLSPLLLLLWMAVVGARGEVECGGLKLLYPVAAAAPLALRYWATAPLTAPNKSVVLAVVVQHGMNLNADEYFCSGLKALFAEYPSGNSSILVLAPRFQQLDHAPDPGELYWADEGWNMGGDSVPVGSTGNTVSSFAVMDTILTELLNTARFPSLRRVVLIGHSAGGQFVVRYALGSRREMPQKPTVAARYIVANPSTYPYLSRERPARDGSGSWVLPHDRCTDYNTWRYGLDGLNGYMNATGIPVAVKQFAARNVVYLLGLNDTCNEDLDPSCDSHGLDRGCEAMWQGRWRLERGTNWAAFLTRFYGANPHTFFFVPDIGHDGQAMITSKEGRRALFH